MLGIALRSIVLMLVDKIVILSHGTLKVELQITLNKINNFFNRNFVRISRLIKVFA